MFHRSLCFTLRKVHLVNELNERLRQEVNRRTFLAGVGAVGAGTAAASLLSGCGSGGRTISVPTPAAVAETDNDILNFALSFEYLGANYYSHALTGAGLPTGDLGTNPGTIIGGRAVTFTDSYVQNIAAQFAADELGHVRTLRAALGSLAVSQPTIDFTDAFNTMAVLAGVGSSFDPFASQENFLLGAFLFEENDISSYIGAAPLLTSSANIAASASILGTEAYHGGTLRTLIYNSGDTTAIANATKIATLRLKVGGGSEQGLTGSTMVPVDARSIILGRTTGQVLRIALGTTVSGTTTGGFFPNGINGKIRAAS